MSKNVQSQRWGFRDQTDGLKEILVSKRFDTTPLYVNPG